MAKKINLKNHQSLVSPVSFLRRISARMLVYFILGAAVLTISACEEEPQIVFVVDAPLQEYYERFIYEAAIRGQDLEYATYQVDATISDIPEQNVIGQCSWSQTHSHAITIDKAYWSRANDTQKEFVVFHELGHCVLGRNHIDVADVNGNCESIMTSGTGGCRVTYLHNNRNKLLDELFSN